jgi:acyl-CoA synthetase (AMP-forming)/AMP-acid ligase II
MNLTEIYTQWLQKSPEKTAVICGGHRCTYRELELNVLKYTSALKSLGVKEGDRIGFLMDNSLEIIFAFFACFRLKAIAVPARPNSPADELIFSSNHCGIKLYLADRGLIDIFSRIKKHIPDLEGIYSVDTSARSHTAFPSFESIQENSEKLDITILPTDPDSPAVIFYTSGTTSKPKGVTHTHASLKNAAINRCKSLKHTSDSTFLTSSFLCHASAMTIILLPMLHCGGSALFMDKFSPVKFADMLYSAPATNVVASPYQWREVIDKKLLNRPAEYLQYATSGGNTVPLNLRQDFMKATGVPLTSGLGMTECGGYMGEFSSNHPPQALGSPIWNTSVRLVDKNGNDVAQGEIGEIIIKTNSIMKGYWNDVENTEKAFTGEWFHSGDLAKQDEKGFYFFAGRLKTTIIVGTSNVAPGEVEDVLDAHPKIKQSVIVPVTDEITGQALFAFIHPESSTVTISGPELVEYTSEHLTKHKVPKYWHFTDHLEVSGILDKIDRNLLTAKAEKIVQKKRNLKKFKENNCDG